MTASKPKPCTLGSRHKWQLLRKIISTTINGSRGTISKRGQYRCECGATKLGEPGHDSE